MSLHESLPGCIRWRCTGNIEMVWAHLFDDLSHSVAKGIHKGGAM